MVRAKIKVHNFCDLAASHCSLWADNPRPIRAIKLEPTNEEITPSSSQETDITTDTKTKVVVRHEDTNVTAFISARNTLGSLFKRACKHFELDRATSVFPVPPVPVVAN